mgnify:CR=1 FL=1
MSPGWGDWTVTSKGNMTYKEPKSDWHVGAIEAGLVKPREI